MQKVALAAALTGMAAAGLMASCSSSNGSAASDASTDRSAAGNSSGSGSGSASKKDAGSTRSSAPGSTKDAGSGGSSLSSSTTGSSSRSRASSTSESASGTTSGTTGSTGTGDGGLRDAAARDAHASSSASGGEGGTRNRLKAMYIQQTTDMTSAPTTFWSNFDGAGCNAVIYGGVGWWMNWAGQPPYVAWSESDSVIASFLQAVKTHNSSITVYFGPYSDGQTYWENIQSTNNGADSGTSFPQDATYGQYFYLSQPGTFDGVSYPAGLYQWQMNLADATFRSQMGASITDGYRNFNNSGYAFDGIVDDTEWYNDDSPSYVAYTQVITSVSHAAGKIGTVYFGVNPPFTDETHILPFLDLDFAILVWDTQGSSEATAYSHALSCSVPWGFEMRAATTNTDGMTIPNCFSYFAGKFSGGIVPSLYAFTQTWDV